MKFTRVFDPVSMSMVLAFLLCVGHASAQSAPSWWTSRHVLNAGDPADDFAALNVGQVKQLATAAAAEVTARMGSSSQSYWTQLASTISGWQTASTSNDDYATVNVGQLKALALPFYKRLKDAGKISALPAWATQSGQDDFAIANVGQAKALFAFSP